MMVRRAVERTVLPLSRAAGSFAEMRAWRAFGAARCGDYARERLGRSSRWLFDLAALGRAFRRLPSLEDAFTGARKPTGFGLVDRRAQRNPLTCFGAGPLRQVSLGKGDEM